jgi:hypothetical protein
MIAASLILPALTLMLAGCGEKTVTATPGGISKLEQSSTCISCHDDTSSGTAKTVKLSGITGQSIVQEWKRSVHNTSNGAGCADCHEPSPGHPNSCSLCHGGTPQQTTARHDVSLNPDADGKCAKCHTFNDTNKTDVIDNRTTHPHFEHFHNLTSATFPAKFISSQNVGNCRHCHNPHDTSSDIRLFREWARSGKGDINSPAWTTYDFKTRGNPNPAGAGNFGDVCVRCHTATGFVKYVDSGFTDVTTWPDATTYPARSSDRTKEVLGCRACHDDGKGNAYGYQVRMVNRITAFYNYSVNSKTTPSVKIRSSVGKAFPDVKQSNLCLACHTGRVAGNNIKAIFSQIRTSDPGFFKQADFINSHYLSAGATIFRATGYELYSSQHYDDSAAYKHKDLGIAYVNGTKGPCISCHMESSESAPSARHSFVPIDRSGTLVTTAVCGNCHDGRDPDAPALTGGGFESKRDGFHHALDLLQAKLALVAIPGKPGKTFTYRDKFPYFPDFLPATINWEAFGAGTGPNMMGVAYNFNLLSHDYGAFAHNSLYAKRIIYDSLEWLYFRNNSFSNDLRAAILSDSGLAGTTIIDTGSMAVQGKGIKFRLSSADIDAAIGYLMGAGSTRP